MTDSNVQIKIPEQMITGLVMAEMVKALGNQDQLIAAVVKAAIEAKDPQGYSRETIFHKAVCDMIREEAEAAFKSWLEANRERVRKAMLTELESGKGKRIRQIVDGLVSRLTEYDMSVSLSVREGDRA
jgi:hypothetical protein